MLSSTLETIYLKVWKQGVIPLPPAIMKIFLKLYSSSSNVLFNEVLIRVLPLPKY
jgi:hypothetical protein